MSSGSSRAAYSRRWRRTRIVGSVQVTVDGSVARIGRLIVAPDWQGRGIWAARLLRVAEQLAPAEVTRTS